MGSVKIFLGALALCVAGGALFFFLGGWGEGSFSLRHEGEYVYTCAGGATLSLTPNSDAESMTLYPGEGASFQKTILTSEPSATGKRFRGEGVAVFARGEEVRVTAAGRELICHPVLDTENAPFNWGD